ncbi:unnamed protein product [Gongylonema pulchrum]|uniref:Uncharacterized protein n=1 Tax=Gongylonema pulchrum TaxID=637853 RepID=A0A3P6T1A5_9BILA|nr:unnamed protein product [Gongylonema pulchrum]
MVRVRKNLDQTPRRGRRPALALTQKPFDLEKYRVGEKDHESYENASICSCSCYQLPYSDTAVRQRQEWLVGAADGICYRSGYFCVTQLLYASEYEKGFDFRFSTFGISFCKNTESFASVGQLG